MLCRERTIKNNVKYKVPFVCHKIKPFDFSTPSPDDVVLKAQEAVFRRPANAS